MITGILEKLRTILVKDKTPRDSTAKDWLQPIIIASVGVTALILGVRELKWLQRWELNVYDQMLRLRGSEASDSRILLVTITEEDLQQQTWPLPDDTINKLLQKLDSYQPRVIGLNLYRPAKNNLTAGVSNSDIVGICRMSSMGNAEIPPPNLPKSHIGFIDLLTDEDNILRRSLLFANPKDHKCRTDYSFASLLAIAYLQKQGIKHDFIDDNLQLGDTILPPLSQDSGSYENLDASGYQLLLNYRNSHKLAPTVTVTQVLTDQVKPDLVKDRLVIIGTTASSIDPGFYTPFSASPTHPKRTPSVLIHAQVASQLISTALDGRPLIWYLSDWIEPVWIWLWSFTGSVVVFYLRHPIKLAMAGGVSLSALVGICSFTFLQAGWIPVVPPALALVFTGVGMMVYTAYQTQQESKLIILQVEKQKEAIEQLNTLLSENSGIQDQHHHFVPNIEAKKTGDLLLGGRYKILKVLGSGGFGCTYVAEDTQRPGNPTCVVKQLMPARRDTRFLQVARRLFNTEAEILEALGKHSQIPTLLAYFEDNQEFYLVQEYIQGNLLNDELPPRKESADEAFVINMLTELLKILEFIHEHRVIHRDIKPSNIIRNNENNRLVLIDFGAVKMMQPPSSENTELSTIAIGTKGYAPPEQFAGHPRLCSDIYALGMIAIQALTGKLPQELYPNLETGTVEWQQWTQVSTELAEILDKMVRYHFSDRYQSATEVLKDLKAITIGK
ncbi:MAG: CHASE2 domain-containing serine/threonine-protein kinase [Nostocaceae cyanobacterium]|nr:CHASE2 domain-containing serine/threonine-protein kinase [Nostocaceae cyanobacterium]